MRALGVRAALENGVCTVSAGEREPGTVSPDCGESGSTLRFLIPIAAALGVSAVFTGHGRLPSRPIGLYAELLPQHGVSCRTQGGLPFAIEGRLTPGYFPVPGNVSSQFITGLLLALRCCSLGDSEIILTTPLESAAYVEMTVQAMTDFGVTVERTKGRLARPGRTALPAPPPHGGGRLVAGGLFPAAGALGGDVTVTSLRPDSLQGDKAIAALLAQGGARLSWEDGRCAAPPSSWRGVEIDAAQFPTLCRFSPPRSPLAQGTTVISHAERLRIRKRPSRRDGAGALRSRCACA